MYLLPTAARFLFDLQMRNNERAIAIPSMIIEPRLARRLLPPTEKPTRSHPPKPLPPLDWDSEKSCRKMSIEVG